MQNNIFEEDDENEVATIETTLVDIKSLVGIIEETLKAPKALPNRKVVLRNYIKQLRESALRLSMLIVTEE